MKEVHLKWTVSRSVLLLHLRLALVFVFVQLKGAPLRPLIYCRVLLVALLVLRPQGAFLGVGCLRCLCFLILRLVLLTFLLVILTHLPFQKLLGLPEGLFLIFRDEFVVLADDEGCGETAGGGSYRIFLNSL